VSSGTVAARTPRPGSSADGGDDGDGGVDDDDDGDDEDDLGDNCIDQVIVGCCTGSRLVRRMEGRWKGRERKKGRWSMNCLVGDTM